MKDLIRAQQNEYDSMLRNLMIEKSVLQVRAGLIQAEKSNLLFQQQIQFEQANLVQQMNASFQAGSFAGFESKSEGYKSRGLNIQAPQRNKGALVVNNFQKAINEERRKSPPGSKLLVGRLDTGSPVIYNDSEIVEKNNLGRISRIIPTAADGIGPTGVFEKMADLLGLIAENTGETSSRIEGVILKKNSLAPSPKLTPKFENIEENIFNEREQYLSPLKEKISEIKEKIETVSKGKEEKRQAFIKSGQDAKSLYGSIPSRLSTLSNVEQSINLQAREKKLLQSRLLTEKNESREGSLIINNPFYPTNYAPSEILPEQKEVQRAYDKENSEEALREAMAKTRAKLRGTELENYNKDIASIDQGAEEKINKARENFAKQLIADGLFSAPIDALSNLASFASNSFSQGILEQELKTTKTQLSKLNSILYKRIGEALSNQIEKSLKDLGQLEDLDFQTSSSILKDRFGENTEFGQKIRLNEGRSKLSFDRPYISQEKFMSGNQAFERGSFQIESRKRLFEKFQDFGKEASGILAKGQVDFQKVIGVLESKSDFDPALSDESIQASRDKITDLNKQIDSGEARVEVRYNAGRFDGKETSHDLILLILIQQ